MTALHHHFLRHRLLAVRLVTAALLAEMPMTAGFIIFRW